MQTITPVLFVDTIEPSLPFWEGPTRSLYANPGATSSALRNK